MKERITRLVYTYNSQAWLRQPKAIGTGQRRYGPTRFMESICLHFCHWLRKVHISPTFVQSLYSPTKPLFSYSVVATSVSLFAIILQLLLLSASSLLSKSLNVVCNEKDQQTLVVFKHRILDPYNWLSLWSTEEDCYKWTGIQCDSNIGRVTKLNLQLPGFYCLEGNVFKPGPDIKPAHQLGHWITGSTGWTVLKKPVDPDIHI